MTNHIIVSFFLHPSTFKVPPLNPGGVVRNLGGGEAHVEVDHQGDARVGGGADRQGPDPIKPLTLFFTFLTIGT